MAKYKKVIIRGNAKAGEIEQGKASGKILV
jgi:hypothetical protein